MNHIQELQGVIHNLHGGKATLYRKCAGHRAISGTGCLGWSGGSIQAERPSKDG